MRRIWRWPNRLARLAREELRHYEQVAKLIRVLGIEPRRLAPGRYAGRLRHLVARGEPAREMDLMICGAFIEARSCERFAALTPVVGAPLQGLFAGLHEAEERHGRTYLELARAAAGRSGLDLDARSTSSPSSRTIDQRAGRTVPLPLRAAARRLDRT